MDINTLTTTHLKQAMSLLSKKEALQNQLASIDEQIADLLGGTPAPAKQAPAVKAKATRSRASKPKGRGALKASILAELKSAGVKGVSIKDLVSKLKSKSANLHAWFNVTGKKMGGIEKIGRGTYRLAS